MIRNRNAIFTDSHGREVQEEKHTLFGLTANDGDIWQYAAGYIPSHWHTELEIFVLLEGVVQIGTGSRTCQLQAFEGCFINTGVIHSFTAMGPSPCRFRSFVFHPDMIAGTPGSIFDTAYVRPLLESGVSFLKFEAGPEDRIYFEQFERAFAACAMECYGFEFQVRDALSQILLLARARSQTAPARAIPSVQETRLKEMLAWIDSHLSQNFSVSEIAAANISPRECQRIFHQYLHYSPTAYVRKKRIFNAAKQLSGTDDSITDIALSCGCASPSHFSRQFRECMGSTPSRYRTARKETGIAASC